MKMFTRLIPIVVLAATSGLTTAHEATRDNVEVQSRAVTFNRAAAQSQQGAQALYRRVRSAAHDVCSGSFSGGAVRWDVQGCTATALDRAVRDIDVPALTAIHYRSGPAKGTTVEVIAAR